jgi:peptidoglycan/xylan/chitin deacetylase (PgdA/CDA1 family)
MKRSTRVIGALAERVLGPLSSGVHGLTVLGYHRIDDSGGHLSVRTDDFKAHLDFIQASGLQVIDVTQPEFPRRADAPCVAITFDDGYQSVAERAWPELKARGWPATVYVVPRYLEGGNVFPWDAETGQDRARLMDRDTVRDLADDGMTIGSHSLSHRYLPALTVQEALQEIVDSRTALEDLLGQEIRTFSYPMGGWNRFLRGMVERAGYSSAVTCRRGRNTPRQDPLALRRPIVESDPIDFVRIVDGFYDWLRPFDWFRERRRQKASATPSGVSS